MFSSAIIVACAPVPLQPFEALSHDGSRVIDLVAWLGSIDDLTRASDISRALGVTPHKDIIYCDNEGKHVPNWLEVLEYVPLPSAHHIVMSYRVLFPDCLAALGQSRKAGTTRADIHLSLNGTSDCVTLASMMVRYKLYERDLLTDGAGFEYTWLVGAHGRWHTYASINFGPKGTDCTNSIWLKQTIA